MGLSETVNYTMFQGVARNAIRTGLKAEGRKIGLADLSAETESLAYALAEIACARI